MLERINSFVWGNGLVLLLLFTGILYTLKLRFIQFRAIPFVLRSAFSENKNSNRGLSQWKTVCMSLGTAMGTGNITGVAAALAIGGPGSIFWMWVSAFLGMALVYSENSLSVKYSTADCKGPMAYISKGLGSPVLAVCFAVFCVLASLGMGSMVQVSAVAQSIRQYINVNPYILAVIVFAAVFTVVSGGADRIGTAAQYMLPAASVAYAVACIWIISTHIDSVPAAFMKIFSGAFGVRQAVGGISGALISKSLSVGIRRGIFSNEAGLGSSPLLHSSAESDCERLQGMWAMFEVFFDTMVCCTLSAVTFICASSEFSVSETFSTLPLGIGKPFIAAELTVFAFCTIIGWYYCGESAFSYILPNTGTMIFCLIYAFSASLGAVCKAEAVWTLSDIFNGLMAFPNLAALLLMIKKVKRE